MIDFHAHILPGIDDGAKNSKESVKLLRALASQGVTKVLATPHFYPGERSVEEFLEDRQNSIERLIKALSNKEDADELPKIAVGAEVLFYPSVAGMEGLSELCISGTEYMLLEMPFEKWMPRVFDGVYRIIANCGITPIIAHIDRYIVYGNDISAAYQLKEMGAVVQVNAEFFTSFKTKRKAVSYFRHSAADVLGSDSHNMEKRAPEIGKAVEYAQKKAG